MMNYSPGEIVLVPFPFIERPVRKVRPALVLSNTPDGEENEHLLLAMITSAKRSRWQSDILLRDWSDAGLKAASILRWKVFTLEAALVEEKRGELSEHDRTAVKEALKGIITI